MNKKIRLAIVLTILNVSSSTVRRLINENNFPKPIKVGNQHYFETDFVYKWISKEAGRKVTIGDKLLSSKQLEILFSRSSAFIWSKFQKNKSRKAKAIYLRSRPHWLESEIFADLELCEYLEVAQKEVA